MAHTPGPWKFGLIGTANDKRGRAIYGPKGEQIADLSADLLPFDEQLDNALVMIAAPDLLAEQRIDLADTIAALTAEHMDKGSSKRDAIINANPVVIRKRALIAKAEGK